MPWLILGTHLGSAAYSGNRQWEGIHDKTWWEVKWSKNKVVPLPLMKWKKGISNFPFTEFELM